MASHPHTLRRANRRGSRGQVLVIFALLALFLFAVTGLAVDAGLAYLTDNGGERAAAAGALAGVPYMPTGYGGAGCTGGNANIAVCAATARDGFANGGTRNGHPVSVTASQYPAGCSSNCDPNKLTVSVTGWANTSFLRVLGFGDHPVTATATAYYLPALTLGQPGAEQGSTVAQLSSSGCCYLLRTEGWATDRGQGDAYTPNPADPGNTSLASTTDVHGLSKKLGTDYGLANSPAGFNPLPDQGGYNFQIVVPAGTSNANLMVYNPAFSPNASGDYHENDSINNTDYTQYSVMEYTLFKVNDQFDHTQDTALAQMKVSPIDATSGSSSNYVNAITGGTLTNTAATDIYHNWVDIFNPSDFGPDSGGGKLISKVGGNFTSSLTANTTYRLRVDTLDDTGGNPPTANPSTNSAAHKGYALEVALSSNAGTMCTTCGLGAIDDFNVYTPLKLPSGSTSGSFDIPLVNINPNYAGLTVNFYVFDPGDLSFSSNLLSVINPDCLCPAGPTSSQNHVPIFNLGPSRGTTPVTVGNPGVNEITNGNAPLQRPSGGPDTQATLQTIWSGCPTSGDCYNGNWLLYKVTIPSSYATSTNPNGTFWKLRYQVTGGSGASANDTFTMVVSFDGTPVHLIP